MNLKTMSGVPVPAVENTEEDESEESLGENSSGPAKDINLLFSQFHPKKRPNVDPTVDSETLTISCMEFNKTGDMLALGDSSGWVTIYKRNLNKCYRNVNFVQLCDFPSHEPEFDFLKSIEIDERIVQVRWVPWMAQSKFLLAANDKTIKLWKIGENSKKLENKKSFRSSRLSKEVAPSTQIEVTQTLRKSYSNGHSYHINTMSMNSDQETFLSSDDLRVNLWHLDNTGESFVIVDVKPENMEMLQEVITTATFHPSSCNIFCYGTSRGVTRLCDMRTSALCDKHSKLFHDRAADVPMLDGQKRNIYQEIIESVNDAKFSNSGRYLAIRTYTSLTIWDTQMENKPLSTIPIQEYLAPHFHKMYDNDCIFDRFNVSWNATETRLITGSYNNLFSVSDRLSSTGTLFEVPYETKNPSKSAVLRPKSILDLTKHDNSPGAAYRNAKNNNKDLDAILLNEMDFTQKTLVNEWHPKENILAVSSASDLYIFQDKKLFN